ncbi:MAG: hypothetical protein QM773_06290 [Hyphomonadaceae bacterium]
MQLNSSQRWASGAIALTVLLACSPQAEPPPAQTALETPAAVEPPPVPAAIETPPQEPGYAGVWALADADCGNAARTFDLSSQSMSMAPGGKACVVKSREEEHPTGRSMIYHIMADCGGGSGGAFTLNFGASDTVMQMKVNDREPVRLVRCPNPQTP